MVADHVSGLVITDVAWDQARGIVLAGVGAGMASWTVPGSASFGLFALWRWVWVSGLWSRRLVGGFRWPGLCGRVAGKVFRDGAWSEVQRCAGN